MMCNASLAIQLSSYLKIISREYICMLSLCARKEADQLTPTWFEESTSTASLMTFFSFFEEPVRSIRNDRH